MGSFELRSPRILAAFASTARRLRGSVAHSTWVVAALTLGLGALPVLSRPGYESALIFGSLLPSVVAADAATTIRARGDFEPQLIAAVRRASLHAAILVLGLCLHATLRGGWCSPGHDLRLLALGPVCGMFAGAFAGSFVGALASMTKHLDQRRWARVLLGVSGPVMGMVLGLVDFYTSPSVFAFDQFVGFFAGSPYDTGFDPTPRLVSYRAGTIGLLVFSWAAARHVAWDDWGRLRRADLVARAGRWRWRLGTRTDRAALALGFFGLGLFVVITAMGESLGHRSSSAFVRKTLSQQVVEGRCEVRASPNERHEAILRLAKDCNAWLSRLERRLGTAPLAKVTAYVFESSGQKELLMGAARTQIAKPWRREIYLNSATYPDDVVGHELAHVVGGQVARGPFKVAGALGGWLPNPGLIEGLAVALAPDEDGDLTAVEWSAALRQIGKLPGLADLFSLGFLRHSGPLAYTVSGAFVEWLGTHHGKVAVRRWYQGESLEAITGLPVAELERQFHRHLESVALPGHARDAALAKFARPGVYSRACPHAVDRCLAEADQKLASGDAEGACQLYEEARKLDRSELRARFGLGECALRIPNGTTSAAEAAFFGIAEDVTLPEVVRQRAKERLADLLLAKGDKERARRLYDVLADATFEADRRRTLDVKRRADGSTELRAIETLLLGIDGEHAWDVAVRDLVLWSLESPNDGTPDYLLGRNYWQKGRESAAAEHLERALQRGLPTPELLGESLRQRVIVACALGDTAAAISLSKRMAREGFVPTPRRLGVRSLVERCAGELVGDDWPESARSAEQSTAVQYASTAALAPPSANAPAVHSASDTEAQPRPVSSASQQPYDSDDFHCPPGMTKVKGALVHLGSSRSNADPDEYPRFQTRVRGFCLDVTEVTVEAYDACVAKGACRPARGRSASCNARHADRKNHPINCVNHQQATEFCKARGARLPTEIEWEFAARGGPQSRKYPWGDASPDGRACWKTSSSCPVATFARGAFDLYDMSGNVWEWTASDFGPYPWSTPVAGDVQRKIYRGGGWSRRFEKWMQLGLRNRAEPHEQGAHLGFRCALSPEHLGCPFDVDATGRCRFGVVDVECRPGETWNGLRCAKPGEPACSVGYHPESEKGCVRDLPMVIQRHAPDLARVQRQRSPEFDADCRRNQPKRPSAYRYSGSSHEARNLASTRAGCKNRDVGAGWNSTCCP